MSPHENMYRWMERLYPTVRKNHLLKPYSHILPLCVYLEEEAFGSDLPASRYDRDKGVVFINNRALNFQLSIGSDGRLSHNYVAGLIARELLIPHILSNREATDAVLRFQLSYK